jgi:hypothetical protein
VRGNESAWEIDLCRGELAVSVGARAVLAVALEASPSSQPFASSESGSLRCARRAHSLVSWRGWSSADVVHGQPLTEISSPARGPVAVGLRVAWNNMLCLDLEAASHMQSGAALNIRELPRRLVRPARCVGCAGERPGLGGRRTGGDDSVGTTP